MTFKEIRARTGMTQQQISEFLNIPKRTFEKWEQGESRCPEYVKELILYKLKNEGIFK